MHLVPWAKKRKGQYQLYKCRVKIQNSTCKLHHLFVSMGASFLNSITIFLKLVIESSQDTIKDDIQSKF